MRWNRRSFVVGAGLASASLYAAATRPQSDAAQPAGSAEVDSLIAAERKRIADAMASGDIPGVAVCFIHDGRVAWTEGFGVTDRRSQRRVGADTIFSIQSTSKNFTATAVMLAVQHGILDLDTPISAYLPEFRVHSRFEPAPQDRMTLRILLANRAGFTHEAPVGNNYAPEFPSFEAHVRSISDTWLRFPVGERYRYSNLGFDLAGYILQIRGGMPFAQWLERMVFEPLGMRDTTVATDVYAARRNRALGHDRGYATVPLKTPLIPSGGVYTSARDMAAYGMFHLGRGQAGGRTILKEELWNEMHAFAFGGDYSLGTIRQEVRRGDTNLRLLSHQGGGFGFGCVFNYCPQAGLAWAALFNRPVSAAYRFGGQLLDDVLTQRFGPSRPRLPIADLPTVELPAAWLQRYVGNYVGRSADVDVTIKDGKLVGQQGAQAAQVLFTSPEDLHTPTANGDSVSWRYFAGSPQAPAHFESFVGENGLDYNDGPRDNAGPDKPEWDRYLGAYRIDRWGKPDKVVTLHRQNGYLYLDRTRLVVEHEPGLFFTSDGEAVDLRGAEPTWRSVRLRRV